MKQASAPNGISWCLARVGSLLAYRVAAYVGVTRVVCCATWTILFTMACMEQHHFFIIIPLAVVPLPLGLQRQRLASFQSTVCFARTSLSHTIKVVKCRPWMQWSREDAVDIGWRSGGLRHTETLILPDRRAVRARETRPLLSLHTRTLSFRFITNSNKKRSANRVNRPPEAESRRKVQLPGDVEWRQCFAISICSRASSPALCTHRRPVGPLVPAGIGGLPNLIKIRRHGVRGPGTFVSLVVHVTLRDLPLGRSQKETSIKQNNTAQMHHLLDTTLRRCRR